MVNMDSTEHLAYQISHRKSLLKNSLKKLKLVHLYKNFRKYYFLIKFYCVKYISLYLVWAFGDKSTEKVGNLEMRDLNHD